MSNSVPLINAEHMAQKYPYTFDVPSRETRNNLLPGQFAQVGFLIDTPGNEILKEATERMWVKVTEKKGNVYIGTLSNEPITFPEDVLKFGDVVSFESHHILKVLLC